MVDASRHGPSWLVVGVVFTTSHPGRPFLHSRIVPWAFFFFLGSAVSNFYVFRHKKVGRLPVYCRTSELYCTKTCLFIFVAEASPDTPDYIVSPLAMNRTTGLLPEAEDIRPPQ